MNGAVCGYKSGENCSTKSCDDIFPKANDAACREYLPSCLQNYKTCVLAQCYYFTSEGNDTDKAEFCLSLIRDYGIDCGYKSGENCSAKSCDDIFPKTNDEACKSYLPTCYLSAENTCSPTKTAACNTYATQGTNNDEKAAFCKTHLDMNGAVCGYKSGENCSTKSCDDIFPKANDAACKSYLPTCYLSAANTCSLLGTGKCNSYNAEGSDSTAKAAFCNAKLDDTGAVCGYKSGNNCSSKACDDIFTAKNDSDCNSYLKGCK